MKEIINSNLGYFAKELFDLVLQTKQETWWTVDNDKFKKRFEQLLAKHVDSFTKSLEKTNSN